jgi:pimeloyl-ACP methyl ester carboxylesterase
MNVIASEVSVEAGSLRLVCLGQAGRPLLVIHGGPDWDHSYLIPAVSALVEVGVQPTLFDLRGCGGSVRLGDPSAYTVSAVVQDICDLLDALGLPQVDVLGFSFGGIVAQELLAMHASRVDRLVLAATAYPFVSDSPLPRSGRVSANLEARIKWLFNSEPNPMAASRMLAEESLELDVHLPASLATARKLIDKVSFSGEWMKARRAKSPPEQRRIRVNDLVKHGERVLFLHGEQDRRFPVDGARTAHALVQSSHLGVVPNAGHLAFIDDPQTWNQQLSDFLGRNR